MVHAMKNHQPHAHSWQNLKVRELSNQHVSIWHTNQPAKSKSCANSSEMEEKKGKLQQSGETPSGIDSEWNAGNPTSDSFTSLKMKSYYVTMTF